MLPFGAMGVTVWARGTSAMLVTSAFWLGLVA